MKIPFQDSRFEMNRRWTDYERLRKIRVSDIFEIITNCEEFMEPELRQLRELIDDKLKSIQAN